LVEPFPTGFSVPPENAGQRLDQFLSTRFADTSRSRIQMLISAEKVLVDDKAAKPSLRLRGGEVVKVLGAVELPPLRAIAEEIPLDIVYEDEDLAVINKPAGMMVHAGAGATEDSRNRGTLVNALLHRFGQLSGVGGELRPGIVHRLDKETSGLILVAKNDVAHRALGSMFSKREVKKIYIALVHGWPQKDQGTIRSSITRDSVRRIRMTTRGYGGREAITHFQVQRRIASLFGKFALVEIKIDTGRTHQIRVHMSSMGHPVVGDALYGAPREVRAGGKGAITLARNFLHAAALQFQHPKTGETVSFSRPLPAELQAFLNRVECDE
jgi:23S rRNA pseudouridine1911/1915/1917 synthase